MSKEAQKEEYALHGARAFHGPTGIEIWFQHADQKGDDRDVMHQRGVLGDYDEAEIVKLGSVLLYRHLRYWECPLCDAVVDREDPLCAQKAYGPCKLKEHYGAECIAHHQETRARELLATKG